MDIVSGRPGRSGCDAPAGVAVDVSAVAWDDTGEESMPAHPGAVGTSSRGAASRPVSEDREAPFTVEELFFSTTDRRGRIRSGNQVFVRTSGYARDELLGRPHNLIRHPDMPRTAFWLLWRAISDGEPFAAYVKNRAKDGAYYWVLAYVVAAADGYLSVRLKPTSALFEVVQQVYGEMLAVEADHEDGSRAGREAGMAAAEQLLLQRLGEHGFESYEQFMHAALVREARAREAVLDTGRSAGGIGTGDPRIQPVLEACQRLDDLLDGLVGDMDDHVHLREVLEGRSRFVLSLAERIRLHSFNALFASSRLGERGAALSAVASIMREHSDAIRPTVAAVDAQFTTAVAELEQLAFEAAAGRLQTEMALHFLRDVTADADVGTALTDTAVLVDCLTESVMSLCDSLDELHTRLAALLGSVDALERDLGRLRALEVNGRVEDARVGNDAGQTLFDVIGDELRAAQEEIGAIKRDSERLVGNDSVATAQVRREVRGLREVTTAHTG